MDAVLGAGALLVMRSVGRGIFADLLVQNKMVF